MDPSRNELEVWRAKLDLDLANKLRTSEDRLDARVRSVETKLNQVQQVAGVLGGLAVIFGVSGAWGYVSLAAAREKLTALQAETSVISTQVVELNALKNSISTTLSRASDAEVSRFTASTRDLQQKMIGELNNEINAIRNNASNSSIDVRSIRVVDKAGRVLLLLSANEYGGIIKSFSTNQKLVAFVGAGSYGGEVELSHNEGETVASLGSFHGGDGRFTLRNTKGRTLIAASTAGRDGTLTFFDRESDAQLVTLSGSSALGGYITLRNSQGSQIGKLPN